MLLKYYLCVPTIKSNFILIHSPQVNPTQQQHLCCGAMPCMALCPPWERAGKFKCKFDCQGFAYILTLILTHTQTIYKTLIFLVVGDYLGRVIFPLITSLFYSFSVHTAGPFRGEHFCVISMSQWHGGEERSIGIVKLFENFKKKELSFASLYSNLTPSHKHTRKI